MNPIAVVRNVGTATTTVTGRLTYTDQGGATIILPVPTFQLNIGEVTAVDLEQLLRQSGEAHPDAIGGLEIEYSTAKGSVTASAFSVGDGGNQLFRVPMWDIYALRSSTGGYPWHIDEASSTTVYIKNGDDHRQHYFMQVNYDGGVYSIGSTRIEPHQTVAYNLRRLRDEQVPDTQGRVIPVDASSGQVHWSKVGGETGVLVGRSEQADMSLGISSNYACANCCDDNPDASDFKVLPNSTSANIDDSVTFRASVLMNACYGNPYYTDVDDAIWSSSNPDVATIGAGIAEAKSDGTTNINAEWHTYRYLAGPPTGGGPLGGGECSAFQVTLHATAASLTVQCRVPGSETTTFGGWDDEDGNPTIAKWNQTLLPTSTSFVGRFVTETDPGGGSDGCHFPDSEIDPVTAVNGTTWQVTSGNHWGPDGNGLAPVAVNYYRDHNRAPCTITIPQQMFISCGLNPINYVTHTLTYTIGTQTVRSEHNGAIIVRAWP